MQRRALVLFLCFLLAAGVCDRELAFAQEESVESTVEFLIRSVEESGLTFLRNGEAHDGRAAAAHIRSKYERGRRSIRTPEEFIEHCASRSMLSGKDYLVVLPGGEQQPVRDWLAAKLRARHEHPTQK